MSGPGVGRQEPLPDPDGSRQVDADPAHAIVVHPPELAVEPLVEGHDDGFSRRPGQVAADEVVADPGANGMERARPPEMARKS